MQWAAGPELSGPALETAGWDPGLSTDQRTAGIRGGGDQGLWMRGAGSGLGDGRGLHRLRTCPDERAEVLGGWLMARGPEETWTRVIRQRGAEGRRMPLGRRDRESAL